MADIVQITAKPITCHSWNADYTKVALCPNNNEVHIYSKQGNEWKVEHVLKEHDQLVTGIDWGHKKNRIVTSSQDRNAYVWTFSNGAWSPVLVILRINRAATWVKWSPFEDKFAVASGAKCVSICYFEEDNDWWVSKHIKKHRSTVLQVAWHPNNLLIATASTDFKARVFSAFVKGCDRRPSETPFGTRLPFGELLAEYDAGGWVHSVRFAPSGNQLAFSSHDSTVGFVDVTNGAPGDIYPVRLKDLPVVDIEWIGEEAAVGVGFDCNPIKFRWGANGWEIEKQLDSNQKKEVQKAGGTRAAFNMFQNKVKTGQNTGVQKLNTKHQNAITCVNVMGGNKVSTSGLDGKLGFWTV